MKKEIYRAAVEGNIEFLKEARTEDLESKATPYNDADLLELTSHGNNIIHLAAEHGHREFIEEALKGFQSAADRRNLICGTNSDADTPLHFAAKQHTKVVAEILVDICKQLLDESFSNEKEVQNDEFKLALYCWRVRNEDGNTPLHVALLNGGKSIGVAAYLLEIGPEVATFTNKRKKAPLHLAVEYDDQGAKISATQMINTLNGIGACLDYTKKHFEDHASLTVIELLLNSNVAECCLRDEDGMTPLIRASLKSYLPAVELIIKYCPEAVEICDSRGKNLLHHIKFSTFTEARTFLMSTPEISCLKDKQDKDGNTPLHIAIISCDYCMVKVMMECNANLVIENNDGNSPAALIQSQSISVLHNAKEKLICLSNLDKHMDKEIYKAATDGDWKTLTERLEMPEYEKNLLSRLPDGSNIVHVAVEECPDYSTGQYSMTLSRCNGEMDLTLHVTFIIEALKKFPILSCQTNLFGQTPLHLAIIRGILRQRARCSLCEIFPEHFREIKQQRNCYPLPPWEVKDMNGNTLLHLALKYHDYESAEHLIKELDAKLVREINNSGETPLHILCATSFAEYIDGDRDEPLKVSKMVDLLLEEDITIVYSYDKDGFTPLLRAVHHHQLKIAERIIHQCPQSIKQFDSKFRRSIIHLIKFEIEDQKRDKSFYIPQMKYLLTLKDENGNTPLHVAVKERRFGTIKFLMEILDSDIHYQRSNNDGKTVSDLLSEEPNFPHWFEDFLSSGLLNLPFEIIFDSGRSLYGIHISDMKDYMNTVGVVAALFTTITFTAAFTIPGGYQSEKGIPALAKRAAFKVFMVADVVGMCSSIMVLFCLLWSLTSSSSTMYNGRALIVDLSIGLLQLSFYATLLAFMTGVYATTIDDLHWLAIFTCVMGTIVLLLMRRRFIIKIVFPIFAILKIFAAVPSRMFAGFQKAFAAELEA